MKKFSLRPWHWWMPVAPLVVAVVGWASHRSVKRTLEADLNDEVLTVLNAILRTNTSWKSPLQNT